jgi:hypothetical protein
MNDTSTRIFRDQCSKCTATKRLLTERPVSKRSVTGRLVTKGQDCQTSRLANVKLPKVQVTNVQIIKRLVLKCPITGRVGNGISFRKNSSEWTRNDFRYSAEESAHSEVFRIPKKSQFRCSERTERSGIPRKMKFYGTD